VIRDKILYHSLAVIGDRIYILKKRICPGSADGSHCIFDYFAFFSITVRTSMDGRMDAIRLLGFLMFCGGPPAPDK
jgi:hypothetical protein